MSPGHRTKPTWRNLLRALGSTALTVGLLGWVVGRTDHDAVAEMFRHASPGWFLLAAALVPVQVVIAATRWRRVAADLGLPMARGRAIREYALGIGLGQILPGGLAGDAVRVWRHRRGHGSVGGPLRAAVVERGIGHVAHLVVTLAGLGLWGICHPATRVPYQALPIVLSMLVVSCGILALPSTLPGLGKLAADARKAVSSLRRLAFHASLSLLLVGTILAGFLLCARGLGMELGWAAVTALPLAMLVTVVPFSVGGWGLRDASAGALLGLLGWSPEAALALSAAFGLTVLFGALPGLLVLLEHTPKPPSSSVDEAGTGTTQ